MATVVRGRTALAAILSTCAIAAGLALAVRVQAISDDTAIRQAVRDAVTAAQVTALPPAAYHGGRMSAAMVQGIRERGRVELSKHFAKGELDRSLGALEQHLEKEASGEIRYLAAGVSRVAITSLSVQGVRATVAADADLWVDVAQVQPDGTMAVAHPKGSMILTLELEKMDGSWLVVEETAKYPSGTGP